MPIINSTAKEIHCKILYCGHEGVGKKSTLSVIHSQSQNIQKSSLAFSKEILLLTLPAGEFFSFQTFFHISHLNQESSSRQSTAFSWNRWNRFYSQLKSPRERKQSLSFFRNGRAFIS